MEKKYEFISFGNYVDDRGMAKICQALEEGKVVYANCSCIGHTRAHTEELNAEHYLLKKYGHRLLILDGEDAKPFHGEFFSDVPLYKLINKEV